jgi:hypothetical protein
MPRFHAAHVHAFAPAPRPRPRARTKAALRDFRARGTLKVVRVEAAVAAEPDRDRCALCDGIVDRFDWELWLISGHCCGCEASLSD